MTKKFKTHRFIYKSSITGLIVGADYALKNSSTTVRMKVKLGKQSLPMVARREKESCKSA